MISYCPLFRRAILVSLNDPKVSRIVLFNYGLCGDVKELFCTPSGTLRIKMQTQCV
jgi:hypothetical protein